MVVLDFRRKYAGNRSVSLASHLMTISNKPLEMGFCIWYRTISNLPTCYVLLLRQQLQMAVMRSLEYYVRRKIILELILDSVIFKQYNSNINEFMYVYCFISVNCF